MKKNFLFRVIVYIKMDGEQVSSDLHGTKRKPTPPKQREEVDDTFYYFTKKAFDGLWEKRSTLFPKNGIFKFKTQTKLEVFYWLEYIVNNQISNETPAERQKLRKSFIIQSMAPHMNILLFHKNKRNHPKVKDLYHKNLEHFIILVDEHGENEDDLSSLGVLSDGNTLFFTLEKFKEFLTINKIKNSKTKIG